MAAMTYRCPADPTGCPESSQPGFCQTHRGVRLERVRAPFAATSTAPASAPAHAVTEAAAPSPPGSTVVGASAVPGPGRARLLAVRVLGRVLAVPPGGLLLGREAPDTRYLPGFADLRHVGRKHARLYWHQDCLYLVDLGSANKTFVNGRAISEPVRLLPGQVFNLAGDADVAVVELDENGFEVTGRD